MGAGQSALSINNWSTLSVDGWAGMQVNAVWQNLPAELSTQMLASDPRR